MVFVRYVLNQNTIWQTDLTTYCLIAATFVGSPFVLMTRGHVNVDVLPTTSPARALLARALRRLGLVAFQRDAGGAPLSISGRRPGTTAGSPTPCGARACGSRIHRCAIGLGLLSLQYVADIYNLGDRARARPFGITKERGA